MEVTGAIPWVPTVPRLSSGAGEQILTRQMFRLGQLLHLPEAFLGEFGETNCACPFIPFLLIVTGTDYECHSHGLFVECWWIYISMVILIVIVVKCGKMGSKNKRTLRITRTSFFGAFIERCLNHGKRAFHHNVESQVWSSRWRWGLRLTTWDVKKRWDVHTVPVPLSQFRISALKSMSTFVPKLTGLVT